MPTNQHPALKLGLSQIPTGQSEEEVGDENWGLRGLEYALKSNEPIDFSGSLVNDMGYG